jgi:hypothetical protein
MDQELEAFTKEIEAIKRIVNGFLSTNPALSHMELFSLSIAAKERSDNTKEMEGFAARGEGLSAIRGELNRASCKKCKDTNGNFYCYYGAGNCPAL